MSIQLHPKILELKRRANPVTYTNFTVDETRMRKRGVVSTDPRVVEGYAFVWGVKDYRGTKMMKGCCAKSIRDRGPQSNARYKITFLWQHDQTDPLSLFEILEEDDYGLYFRTKPLDDVSNADRALKQLRSGTLNQFSGGFDYVWDKMEYDESDDSIVCKEIDLQELSIVTIGAQSLTMALRSRQDYDQALEDSSEELNEVLKELPRQPQLRLRQIITRYKSLLEMEPPAPAPALDNEKPKPSVVDYDYLTTNLKLF